MPDSLPGPDSNYSTGTDYIVAFLGYRCPFVEADVAGRAGAAPGMPGVFRGAQVADAGFAVRTGLYLLPDAGYGFAATSASLETLDTLGALAAWAVPDENAPETTAPAREAATPTEELEGEAKHA